MNKFVLMTVDFSFYDRKCNIGRLNDCLDRCVPSTESRYPDSTHWLFTNEAVTCSGSLARSHSVLTNEMKMAEGLCVRPVPVSRFPTTSTDEFAKRRGTLLHSISHAIEQTSLSDSAWLMDIRYLFATRLYNVLEPNNAPLIFDPSTHSITIMASERKVCGRRETYSLSLSLSVYIKGNIPLPLPILFGSTTISARYQCKRKSLQDKPEVCPSFGIET